MNGLKKESETGGALKDQFLDVLKNKRIKTLFQPIVSLRDGNVYGYEALSRGPENTAVENPGVLFECAERYGMVWDLELLCRVKAIEAVSRLGVPLKLFLNVNPQIMHDEKFKRGFTEEYLNRYHIDPQDIVFEITEKGSVGKVSDFIKTVEHYKKQSYKIAIDDAGAGYSGLNLITDVRPHFIKLDMNLVRDIDKDATRQALIRSFHEFASLTNTDLIAEGIETKNELLKLIDIGVRYGQGFYLQKPCVSVSPPEDEVILTIREANAKRNHIFYRRASGLFIGNISVPQRTISPGISISQVYDFMEQDRSLAGICVTEDGALVGMLTRSELYRHLSGQFGYSLYARKPVKSIMTTDFLKVDYHESVETVAKKAMSRDFEHLYDLIGVTGDGKYCGVVTVKDLLEKSLQAEVSYAKHINPLSELPGNVLIEKKLEECVGNPSDCSVLYFDIDNFKAYNDVYGFENGDIFLKSFVRILKQNISEEKDFLGHIGGDDFVAIVDGKNIGELCRNIIGQFDESALKYYNRSDLDRGYITTKNRRGIEEDFPLLSLSIAAVSNKNFETAYKLSEKMAELKKLCKLKTGSNYIVG